MICERYFSIGFETYKHQDQLRVFYLLHTSKVSRSSSGLKIAKSNLTNRKLRNIDRTVSIIIGDQQETDKKVDEHIETYSDGSHKCLLCGKLDIGKGSNGKHNKSRHIRTVPNESE